MEAKIESTGIPMEEEITDSTDDKLTQEIQSTDVLMEILVLLPPKSIFRFMAVSKRWFSIIKDPIFIQTYTASLRRRSAAGPGRLLAFFEKTTMKLGKRPRSSLDYSMNILPIQIHRNIIKLAPGEFGKFINSSGGLILCGHGSESRPTYRVVNPVTGKSVALPPPPPPKEYYYTSTGIMCEENATELVANYTVIRASTHMFQSTGNILNIETYSSRTGEWAESFLVATGNFRLSGRSPVVANGFFHWYVRDRGIAVYDPRDRENHLQLIRMPTFGLKTDADAITVARSADDCLWYGLTSDGRIGIFKLPKGEDDGSYRRKTTIGHEEWVLIYEFGFSRWESIRLEAFIPWEFLVAVVRREEKVYLCNLDMKTQERVFYDGMCNVYYDNALHPYLESPFLSSYAL